MPEDKTSKRYVLINLVSQQALPNIIPMIQPSAPDYSEVYFVHSSSNKEEIELAKIQPILSLYQKSPKIIWQLNDVLPYDIADVKREAEKIFARVNREYPETTIVCNCTGGTKQMAIGLSQAAGEKGYPTIYVDSFVSNKIIQTQPIYTQDNIMVDFDVDAFLKAHGLNVFEKKESTEQLVQAANYIYEAFTIKYLNFANKKKAKIERPFELVGVYAILKFGTYKERLQLAQNLQTCGVVNKYEADGKTVKVTPIKFINGDWLEYYIYSLLKQNFDKVMLGVRFENTGKSNGNNDNEIDVIALLGLKMAFVSCKTGTGDLKTKNLLELMAHNLRAFGSTASASSTLFLALPFPRQLVDKTNNAFLVRAKEFKIEVVCLEDLPKIAEKVAKLLEPKSV